MIEHESRKEVTMSLTPDEVDILITAFQIHFKTGDDLDDCGTDYVSISKKLLAARDAVFVNYVATLAKDRLQGNLITLEYVVGQLRNTLAAYPELTEVRELHLMYPAGGPEDRHNFRLAVWGTAIGRLVRSLRT